MANKKAHRRAKGEGSIFKTKDSRGNIIWRGKIPVGTNPDGSMKYQFVSGKTQSEVKEKADALKGDVRNNTYAEPNKITVAAWMDTWLNVSIKESVKTTTWLSYKSMIDKHIVPEIGGIKLMQLQTSHLQKLYNDKLKGGRADKTKNDKGELVPKEGGLSPRTIRYIHQVVNGALDQAVKEHMISVNVAGAARLPKDPLKEMKVLDTKDVEIFLNTAKNHYRYKRYYTAYLMELYTGMRRGELLGIRWKDIDLKKSNIQVRQQLVKEGSKHVIRELKTESSQNRTIAISDDMIQELKSHRALQKDWLKELGWDDLQIKEQTDNGLVFINELATGFIQPRNFTRNFKGCLKTCKLDTEIRFHDMRHTFALLSLQQGVDIKTLQSDLGHHSIQTTLDRYGHVNMEMKKDAANKRSGLLKAIVNGDKVQEN